MLKLIYTGLSMQISLKEKKKKEKGHLPAYLQKDRQRRSERLLT